MADFETELERDLEAIRGQGLFRELRRMDSAQGPVIDAGGRRLRNFSSNDYLGLAGDPRLQEAAMRALQKFGAGSGASRLICGSLAPHHELEEAIAAFKNTAAALSFSSGYAAALGTICALAGKDDVVVLDKLVHASVVDAARLSGATLRVFRHNDLEDLETILQWARDKGAPSQRVLVVTESVFSMDGDLAPLAEIVELKDRYGAWLMVDEAHATGLYGPGRRGLADEAGVSGHVEVQMGTLGKALGAAGGYICGSRRLIDLLVNRARSFIFSTAPVPASAAAATAGIGIVASPEGAQLAATLWSRLAQFKTVAGPGISKEHRSAIVPWVVGGESDAVNLSATLRERGFYIPAIRYPTVARGRARLRITFTASHSTDDVCALAAALSAHSTSQSVS